MVTGRHHLIRDGGERAAINYFLKILLQKFGNNKKIVSSLHRKTKNMLRIQLHIEAGNWFSPKGGYTSCGACSAAN
mgnify:CR=1 FL=1